jgi:ankyrin repeat protein
MASIPTSNLCAALKEGDPRKVMALIKAGADVRYQREKGYDALIDAVHGRDVGRDPRLLDLLKLLIASGVELSGQSSYRESGLRVLSRIGRFDAVQLLLDAGADKSQLAWTRLMEAVALGSLADMKAVLDGGATLEDADWWSRTAWLIALLAGDISKAEALLARGANPNARGRSGKPPLFYAIEGHHADVLTWLLERGADVEQTDNFGTTALMEAVDEDDLECVEILLSAGADLDRDASGTALNRARTREIIKRLLDAGADPQSLSHEGRRAILGFPSDPDEALIVASPDDFQRTFTRSFGRTNPERMNHPFWDSMIRSGINAYAAGRRFNESSLTLAGPIWCAQRFGQSLTFLRDGRIVQIAGEHEDSYDLDFCIYNDVFVHGRDGSTAIFGYPESVFPPTDFHTATLTGDYIYVIGSLGYQGSRRYGETSVYRLDILTFQIEPIDTRGEAPGWIYKHRAAHASPHEIRVWHGKVVTKTGDEERYDDNLDSFVLDLDSRLWRRETSAGQV